MSSVIGVSEIMTEVFAGPCRVHLRDPRDGRPARLEISVSDEGYLVRVETGLLDDGTDSLREAPSIERAAAMAAAAMTALLRAGYRPLRIERSGMRPA